MRGAKFVGPLPGEPKPQNHKDFTAMKTHADNSQKVKSPFSKDRKPSFLGSTFRPTPTPPHLRIAREEFDSRLAQRRAAGETASSQERVCPAEPSAEARPEAM